MKNIFKLLEEIGLEVPEDKKSDFEKAVNENYKTVAEFTKTKEKLSKTETELSEAKTTITNLGEDLKKSESSAEEIGDLKKKIEDYETAEKNRKEAEKNAAADAELTKIVEEAIGEAEFVNDYTRNSVIADIKKGISENKGKGAKELFEELTKDTTGILKNPQQENIELPAGGNGGKGVTMAQIEEMSEDEILANWKEVSKTLATGGK